MAALRIDICEDLRIQLRKDWCSWQEMSSKDECVMNRQQLREAAAVVKSRRGEERKEAG